MDIIVKQTI